MMKNMKNQMEQNHVTAVFIRMTPVNTLNNIILRTSKLDHATNVVNTGFSTDNNS